MIAGYFYPRATVFLVAVAKLLPCSVKIAVATIESPQLAKVVGVIPCSVNFLATWPRIGDTKRDRDSLEKVYDGRAC